MRRIDGFSLIEAVVVLAIMAILAGAAVPLMVKTLDQQRANATQASLQTGWQAAFGAPGFRVLNMRADFGFDPPGALTDLGKLLAADAPGTPTPLAYGAHGAVPYFYGWNGPYWSGSVATVNGWKVPADGWGRPIQLLNPGGAAWQLASAGADGVLGTADDLVYPSVPVNLGGAYLATVYISIQAPLRTVASAGTWQVSDRSQGAARVPAPAAITVPANGSLTIPAFTVMPGPASIAISFPAAAPYSAVTYSQIVDLLPGQTQVVSLTLN